MNRYSYEIFADHHQFYLLDDTLEREFVDHWNDSTLKLMVATSETEVAISTARNMTVPVNIELSETNPNIDLGPWERVVLCSITIKTGSMVIMGCTDYFPDAARIEIAPGTYEVLVCFSGLNTLSEDGLDGNDVYSLFIYPGSERGPVQVKG